MQPLIEDTRLQVRRYWIDDGLPDLFIGLGLAGYGLLTWLAEGHPSPALKSVPTLLLLLWLGAGGWLIRRLKARITYPRTGYVQYRRRPWRTQQGKWLLGLGLLIASALLVWVLRGSTLTANAQARLYALSFGLLLGAVAWHQRSRRYGLYALVALLVGGGMALSPPAAIAASFLGILGLVLLLGGAWTLTNYLRRHPLPEETV